MTRTLGSWTDAFSKYMENKGSPTLFTRWSGIFAIAAALERKVWIKTNKGVLYPNMYIITVGPPGAGKTLATSVAHDFLLALTTGGNDGHHIAPTSVTKASLIDALVAAERKLIRPMENPAVISFNSLIVTSDELGVFLPAYENDFMNVLTNIYDCRVYSETRRTAKINIKMDAPQLSFSAATTPSYLTSLLPEGAWDQGFLSRTMLIYSGAEAPRDLFNGAVYDEALEKLLANDLAEIANLYGQMKITEDAKEAITAWHISGGAPAPSHPKLNHYNTRRTAHLLKLCMVACASSSSELEITLDHFAEALDWLTEAEFVMPDIFKSMKNGGDARVIEECYHYAREMYMKDKDRKPILEHRLFHYLQERTPAHNVERILNVMERAGLLKKQFADVGMGYIPLGKTA